MTAAAWWSLWREDEDSLILHVDFQTATQKRLIPIYELSTR